MKPILHTRSFGRHLLSCLALCIGLFGTDIQAAPAPATPSLTKAEVERKIASMIEAIVKAQPSAAVTITTAAILAAPEYADLIIATVVRNCPSELVDAVRTAGAQAVAQAAAAAAAGQGRPDPAVAAPPQPQEKSQRNPTIPPPPVSPIINSPN